LRYNNNCMATKRVEELYAIIKEANSELEKIREKCLHENVRIGNYMDGPGRIYHGDICDDCGKFIKLIGHGFMP
jgi:hypothetical protein